MTEQEFTEFLTDAIWNAAEESTDDSPGVFDVASFESAGVLTRNEGIQVHLSNGSVFQVTVVRAR